MPVPALPGTYFHLGYVVPNLDAALAHLEARAGASRFMALRDTEVENGTFRGNAAHITHSMAFGYVGELMFEVIEPGAGSSTYSEFLERVPGGGVHHLAYRVEDFDRALADLQARGYAMVQSGTFGETRFGYFEAGDDLGTLTEIVQLDANTAAMFERIKTQDF